MSTLTATRQRNAVSEGLAFGLAQLDRWSLPYNKTRLDLAFEGAWRAWPHRARYPQVSTDLSRGLDGVRAMTRVNESKQTFAFFWDQTTGRGLEVVCRQSDWHATNPDDIAFAGRVIDDQIPVSGWVSLAEELLLRLDR